jgi:hypothetical protein
MGGPYSKRKALKQAISKEKENSHMLALHTNPEDDSPLDYPKIKEFIFVWTEVLDKLFKINQTAIHFVKDHKHKMKK